MGRTWLKCICICSLMLLALGCAEDQKSQKQVEELQRQVNDLQTTIADLNLRMEEMNSSLFVLRETAKNNHEAIKKLQEELQQPTVYIQEPSGDTVAASEPVMMPAPTAETTPAPLPVGGGDTRENEDAAFGKAMVQMQQSNWGLAIYDLNAFIAQHPGSAYLPRARYALGEAYRNLSEFAQAINEYKRCLAAGQAAGPYAPRALYWMADCYDRQGQTEKAQQTRDRLLREYADSPEAKKIKMDSSR